MAKILLIDDDVDLNEMTRLRLEANGYEVFEASDGLQATQMAHDQKPDLIFLDLFFPAGGGIATLRNLKLSIHTKNIPVIIISGTGDDQLIEEVLHEDIEAFIQKPYDAKDLLTVIQEALK